MIDLRQVLKKAKKLDLSHWRRLFLLAFGALFLGAGWVFLDVASVSYLLKNNFQYTIGANFLILAICLSFVSPILVKLDRRHGYGGVPLTAFLLLSQFGLIVWLSKQESFWPISILFVFKYLVPLLISVSFWTIASRFIVLGFNSLKYLGILAGQLLGFGVAGLFLMKSDLSLLSALKLSLFCWLGLVIIMKVLIWLLPQPSEVFVRKTGGVQDSFEQKVADCILMLAFFFTAGKALNDFLLYQELLRNPLDITYTLSILWMLCGMLGFVSVIFLFQTRFLYTTLWGLLGICLGLIGTALGSYIGNGSLFYSGFILYWICIFLYWEPYLRLLPRPLTLGKGIRLRKMRQMVVEPVGFLFIGAVILTLPKAYFPIFLAIITVLLILAIFLSVSLYSRLLKRLFKMRQWCEGPLVLLSKKLEKYVEQGTQSTSVQEAIYFLRIMEVAHAKKYQKQLLKTLTHPSSELRLFALNKLDKFYENRKVLRSVNQVYQKDKDTLVRSRALAILIRSQEEDNSQVVYTRFGSYLDAKGLKYGAILGFLQSGGERALLAMDGLQKLIFSLKKTDNLMALKIIEKAPNQGLVRLVLPLLKSPHIEVVQAALLVAGKIGHVQTLNDIFHALDRVELQEYALKALNFYGKKVFPPLEKMLQNPTVPNERRKKLISFLGVLSSGEGKQILLRNLYLSDLKLRKEIFSAIISSQIMWISSRRKNILKRGIEQDVAWWNLLDKKILSVQQAPLPLLGDAFSFLRRSFEEMKNDLRTLVLYQILLYNPSDLVKKAVYILMGTPSQRFISAEGILQDLLPYKLYQKIKPLLLDPVKKLTEENPILMDVEESRRFLEQQILSSSTPVNHWIIASSLYGLQRIGDEHSLVALSKALSYPHPVVLEAALELLKRLKPDSKKRQDFLSDQIRKMPHNFVLENYLKKGKKNDYV